MITSDLPCASEDKVTNDNTLSVEKTMTTITGFKVEDLRFPTSLTGDGTDAMNTSCDYSAAYITLLTDGDDIGYGMTFTIG